MAARVSSVRCSSSLPKNEVHQEANDHAEGDSANSPGNPHFQPEDPSGKNNRQHINGRPGVEKR